MRSKTHPNDADSVLEVVDLCKSFQIYAQPLDRLKELFSRRAHHVEHPAVVDISFSLRKGEAIGVIGQNGAGKSTLLKLIMGVLMPDAGSICKHGRIAGLLELGSGFELDATGRENIAINAQLLGLTRAEIAEIESEIIDFSELAEFIDFPVRGYSSGMQMRLGFSIAYHCNPAAFIVDEALSVGDARFQQKCMQKIRGYKKAQGALLFVSHDLTAVRLICDRVLVLHRGAIVFEGTPERAIQIYYQTLSRPLESSLDLSFGSYGKKEVQMIEVICKTASQEWVIRPGSDAGPVRVGIGSGERLIAAVALLSQIPYSASVGLLIRDRLGQDVFGVNTAMLGKEIICNSNDQKMIEFALRVDLAPGLYTLTLAVHTEIHHTDNCQHWWDNVFEVEVVGFESTPFSGISRLPCNVQIL